jgi:hypothetical protein
MKKSRSVGGEEEKSGAIHVVKVAVAFWALSVRGMTWHTSVGVDPQCQQTIGLSSFLMRSRVAT